MSADENDGGWTALDDNIVGDGTADATSKPLDTMLEKLLDVRSREMWTRASTVKKQWYNPSGPESDPRPFTSRDTGAAIMCIPWEVRPGLDEIHVSLKAEVGNDDSDTTGEVELKLELGPRTIQESQTIKATSTGGQSAYTIVLDLSSRSFTPEVHPLVLWVKSEAEADNGLFSLQSLGNYGSTTYVEYEAGGSTDDELDEKAAIGAPAITQAGASSSILPLHESTPVGTDRRSGITVELQQNENTETGFSSKILELSWVKPQGLAIFETYDKTESEGAFVAKPPRTMEPQQPVKGADAGAHPETLDGIVRRPTCRAIGPHGQDQGADWPTDYYRQWSWIETEDESDTLLDRTSFQKRYDSSDIRCIAYVKPFFAIKVLNDKIINSDRMYVAAPQDPEQYAQFVITGDLDLQLTVRQAQSSDTWDNQPSTSTTRTVRDVSLHNARRQPGYPLPNTVFWARHPEGEQSFTDVSTNAEYRYTFYEGALFEEDFQLFLRTGYAISIDPTDGLSLNADEPIRCDLDFGGWSQGPNLDEIDTPSGDTEISYHLLCLGTSWWEEPQI